MCNINCKKELSLLVKEINSILTLITPRPQTRADEEWAMENLERVKSSLKAAVKSSELRLKYSCCSPFMRSNFHPAVSEASLHIEDLLTAERPAGTWYHTLEPTRESLLFYLEQREQP